MWQCSVMQSGCNPGGGCLSRSASTRAGLAVSASRTFSAHQQKAGPRPAHLQLTSLCISGGFQQCPPSFSALARLQDLHFSTTRKMAGEPPPPPPLRCMPAASPVEALCTLVTAPLRTGATPRAHVPSHSPSLTLPRLPQERMRSRRCRTSPPSPSFTCTPVPRRCSQQLRPACRMRWPPCRGGWGLVTLGGRESNLHGFMWRATDWGAGVHLKQAPLLLAQSRWPCLPPLLPRCVGCATWTSLCATGLLYSRALGRAIC